MQDAELDRPGGLRPEEGGRAQHGAAGQTRVGYTLIGAAVGMAFTLAFPPPVRLDSAARSVEEVATGAARVLHTAGEELEHGVDREARDSHGMTALHLATALGTPSVVLFGPTPPRLWGPPPDMRRHIALWSGAVGDPHAHRPDPGLLALTVPDVISAVDRQLERYPAGREFSGVS